MQKFPKVERVYLYYDLPMIFYGEGKFVYMRDGAEDHQSWVEWFVGDINDEDRTALETGKVTVGGAIRKHMTQIVRHSKGNKFEWRDVCESDFAPAFLPQEDFKLDYEVGDDADLIGGT